MSKGQAVAAALLAGLLAGTWLGFAADRRALRGLKGRRPDPERIAKRLERVLMLDAQQTAKVRDIVASRGARHEALRQEHEAAFKALRAEIDAEIEKVLDEGQRRRFAEKRAAWEKRRAALAR